LVVFEGNLRPPSFTPELRRDLQSALNGRVLIEQAKGILAERRHISLAEAFIQMRTYARDHNRLLSQIAQAVITKDPDLIDLAMPPTRQ
jgi:AmiR/NasT family two-component response regulator